MKKTILCIDDIRTNLFTIQSVIEDYAEDLYDVEIAISAADGLQILLKKKIDLILLDVMMPDIDGFEAAQMIKSNKKTKQIPIIFVTANKDDATIEKCYEVGGDDYINKPFNHVELMSRITFHLSLKEKDRLLKQEKEYVQNIFDLQENMILITDSHEPLNVNKALLSFFNYKSVDELKNNNKCICNKFEKEDGFFTPNIMSVEFKWIDEVIRLSKKEDVLVKIFKNETEYIFNVKATAFNEQYIVTFTDVTFATQQSLEYKYEANIDALTQVYNRNMFNRLIKRKIVQAKTSAFSFVFIILDIDYFKKINDTHGHLVGDEILKSLALLIKNHTRDNDLFARWGGEEFVLAFDVDMTRALEIAEHLRAYIEKEVFKGDYKITCSFGLTEYKDSDSLEDMIKRADKALYRAKESGRNRICHN